MKVVLVGPAWPLRGGLAAYNERLGREFQRLGHDFSIVTYSLQYPSFLFPGKSQYSDQDRPENLPIRVMLNSINPFSWYKTGRMIRKEKPDLLIFRYWMPFMAPCQGVIAKMVKKNRKTRIVAVADNIIPHEKFPLGKWLTRFFVRSCDGFVTMSEKVMLDLKAIRPEAPARFIPHPLYDNFGEAVFRKEALKELGLDPEYRYVLFFGFIRKYKGLDLLLDAFADANLQKQKIRLLVAGEFYEDSTPYLNRMKEPDLAGRVICYNDFIPDNRVKYFFSACDIVAQTYRAATQSGVTQVAYQFFKPVLVTDVGGLSEMVPHGKVGYVVPPQTADISSALLRFFSENNPEAFRDGILEERKKFSWENLVNSLLGI